MADIPVSASLPPYLSPSLSTSLPPSPQTSLSQHRSVVVADPFPISRGAVAQLLRRCGGADDVAETGDPDGALEAVRRRGAGMVLTDVDLTAEGDGVRLCARLKRLAHPPAVLMFAGSNDPSVVARCMTAGADGFVHRSATPERLVRAVESVAVGRPVWFLGETARERAAGDVHAAAPRHGMTAREQQVLGLLLGRYSNDEIAAELHLARQTVKNHVSSVLQKLGAANRRELLSAGWHTPAPKGTSPVAPKRDSPRRSRIVVSS
jgi:DNA-binding NarL/FixJ family response regulator